MSNCRAIPPLEGSMRVNTGFCAHSSRSPVDEYEALLPFHCRPASTVASAPFMSLPPAQGGSTSTVAQRRHDVEKNG